MVFNWGNIIINTDFYINNTSLENVKIFKYLGFTIFARNCSFSPTQDDLSLKAGPAVYALNSKIKWSKLPTKLALQVFKIWHHAYFIIRMGGLGAIHEF